MFLENLTNSEELRFCLQKVPGAPRLAPGIGGNSKILTQSLSNLPDFLQNQGPAENLTNSENLRFWLQKVPGAPRLAPGIGGNSKILTQSLSNLADFLQNQGPASRPQPQPQPLDFH